MLRNLLIVFALALSIAGFCRANPVPDAVAKDFKALVVTTARTGTCPAAERLATHFGSFGLDLLSPSDLAALESQFHVFAPIFVDAQRPGHHLDFRIQRLFQKHADAAEREVMLAALREWFTATPTEAQPQGTLRIEPSPGREAENACRIRVVAAEMLGTWGDEKALPLMEVLAASEALTEDLRGHLDRARERIADSTAGTFVLAGPDGSIHLCETINEVKDAVVWVGSLDRGEAKYALTPSEVKDLWAMIGESYVGEDTNYLGYDCCIIVEFADGVRARLNPTDPGHVIYRDNTSLDPRIRLTLQSESLWGWSTDLFERKLEKEVK